MLVPDQLRNNAFRVLQLSSSAEAADVHAAAAKLRRSAALGLPPKAGEDVPVLGPVSRTEAEVAAAVARLADPARRLTDRLFWFHFRPGAQDDDASAEPAGVLAAELVGAARSHDAALHHLMAALGASADRRGLDLVIDALRGFARVVRHPTYWELLVALEQRSGFEPRAVAADIDLVRLEALGHAGESLASTGRNALAQGDLPQVRAIVAALSDLQDTGAWAARARDGLTQPALQRLDAACKTLHQQYGTRIERRPEAVKSNRPVCERATEHYRSNVAPALAQLLDVVPQGHPIGTHARELVAQTLHGLAADWSWAEDFVQAVALNEQARKLARDTSSAPRIEEAHRELQRLADRQRMFEPLTPLTGPPALFTINGFGFTMYFENDFDAATKSCVMTHYAVLAFIPVLPLARYRVIREGNRGYRFLGKLPLTGFDRIHQAIAGTLALALFVFTCGGPHPVSMSSSRVASADYLPAQTAGSARTTAAGRQADAVRQRLQDGRAQIAALEAKLQPVSEQLNVIEADIAHKQERISGMEARRVRGEEVDLEAYESKVRAHNALVRKHRALLQANQSDFDAYKGLLEQDQRLVLQYNGLLGPMR